MFEKREQRYQRKSFSFGWEICAFYSADSFLWELVALRFVLRAVCSRPIFSAVSYCSRMQGTEYDAGSLLLVRKTRVCYHPLFWKYFLFSKIIYFRKIYISFLQISKVPVRKGGDPIYRCDIQRIWPDILVQQPLHWFHPLLKLNKHFPELEMRVDTDSDCVHQRLLHRASCYNRSSVLLFCNWILR